MATALLSGVFAGVTATAASAATTLAVSMTMTSGTFAVQHGTQGPLPAMTQPALTGTETLTTGSFTTATLTIPTQTESNQGSTETILVYPAHGTTVTATVNTKGILTIAATLDYEVHITVPLTFQCVTATPVHVALSSSSAWTPASHQVTVGNDAITVPKFSTANCSLAAGPLDETFSGPGGELSLTLHGTLVVPPPATPTTTTLTATPASPQVQHTAVTLHAAVKKTTGAAATAATGTVQFRDGTTVLATESVSGGTASYATSTLSASTHTLTAVYSGGHGYAGSTSAALAYTVAPAPTVTITNLPATLSGATPTYHPFTVVVTNPAGGVTLPGVFLKMRLSGLNRPKTTLMELRYLDSTTKACTLVDYTFSANATTGYVNNTATCTFTTTPLPLAAGTKLTVHFEVAYPAPKNVAKTGTGRYGTQTVTATLDTGTCTTTLTPCTSVAPLTGSTAPSSTATVAVLPKSPFPSKLTTSSPATVRQTFTVELVSTVAPATPVYGRPFAPGTVTYTVDGTVVATSNLVKPTSATSSVTTTVVRYNTAGLGLGTHHLVVTYVPTSYTGHLIYEPSTYATTFTVITAPTGTAFTCSISGFGDRTVPAYVTAHGTVPPATLTAATTTLAATTVAVTLTVDPSGGTGTYNTNQSAAALYFSSTGTPASAKPITFTSGPDTGTVPITAAKTPTEVVGTWTGVSTSVPVPKDAAPGSTLAVGVTKISFAAGNTVWTCTATTATVPAPVASTEIAGTTLAVSPSGSAPQGATVTLMATVYPTPTATSVVTFFDGTQLLGSAVVATSGPTAGKATVTSKTLAAGTHTLRAVWNGVWSGTPGANVVANSSNTVAYSITTAAPTVTTQPVPVTIGAGDPVTFSAGASGTPAPTIQWQVSGDGGSTWTTVPGATTPALSFTAATTDTGDQYRAVFTNDAGTATSTAATLTVTVDGYRLVASDGSVYAYGNAPFYGSMGGKPLNAPIVGTATTPGDGGYWEVASDGGIFAFGDAQFLGSMGGKPLNAPIVGMAATPDGGGYWEVASDGGIFAFGDAPFYGSMGGKPLNQPIVSMAATPDGGGYWEVASDGGIFAFGDATFFGSMGGKPLNQPITAMAATPTGAGYWEVASDGGVFSFGDAPFLGTVAGTTTHQVVDLTPTTTGAGYWEVTASGQVFQFGDATLAGTALTQGHTIVAMSQ